jgi:hypothetical protein
MIETTNEHNSPGPAPEQAQAGRKLDTSFLRDSGSAGAAPEAREAGERRFSVGKTLRILLLGLLGFLLGALLFVPADALWARILGSVESEQFTLDWERIEPSGMFGANLYDAVITVNGLEMNFTSVNLDPGLATPIRVTAVTGGSELNGSYSWSKRLAVEGAVDAGKLLGPEMGSGEARLDADLQFNGRAGIPEQGALKIRGLNLNLPNNLALSDLTLDLNKQGRQVRIENFRTRKPFPIQAGGNLTLDPGNLPNSTYEVQGTIRMGGKVNKFKKSGSVGELKGLASGKGP